jgi:hypothetical protein
MKAEVVGRYSEVVKRYLEASARYSEVGGRYSELVAEYSKVVAGYSEDVVGYSGVSSPLVDITAGLAAFAAAVLGQRGRFERGLCGLFFKAPNLIQVGRDFGDEAGGALEDGLS